MSMVGNEVITTSWVASGPAAEAAPNGGRLRRAAYTAGGLLSVFVAFVGVFLPGIPTTGPLILASFLLAKGNPAMQRQLLRCGFFRKYFEYLEGDVEMPMRARCWAAFWMWTSILASSLFLLTSGAGGWPIVTMCVLAGAVGTVVIFRFRRPARKGHPTATTAHPASASLHPGGDGRPADLASGPPVGEGGPPVGEGGQPVGEGGQPAGDSSIAGGMVASMARQRLTTSRSLSGYSAAKSRVSAGSPAR